MTSIAGFILFVVLISLTVYSNTRVVDSSQSQISNGITYCLNEDKPFTGTMISWYENGQKRTEVHFKSGKYHGKAISWFENGQEKSEVNFKDGKLDGKVIRWHENGQRFFP